MRDYMFRNRWGALLFVGLTLAGVTTLVGTDEDGGALARATGDLAEQKAAADRLFGSDQPLASKAGDVGIAFTPDEELIDEASGDEPAPADEFVSPDELEVVPEGQVVIVSRDDPRFPERSPDQ